MTLTTLPKEVKYLELAQHFAKTFSKDESTQVGAMFLHPTEFTILTAGYNGIPRGCNDEVPERHSRPLKYEYFEHAERNAIYNSVRTVFRGSTVVCTAPLYLEDIRALISVGVSTLCTALLPEGDTVLALLTESGVQVRGVPDGSPQNRVTFHKIGCPDAFASGEYIVGSSAVIHTDDSAVRRTIFDIARPLLTGSTLVVGPLPPCISCARAVASVGVKRVISYSPTEEQDARWGSSFAQTRDLLAEKGIVLLEIER